MRLTIPYRFEVIPMTLWPGGGYFVHVPELPGCYVIVDNLAEIEAALESAIGYADWCLGSLPEPAVMDYERRIEWAVNARPRAPLSQVKARSEERNATVNSDRAA